MNDGRSLRGTFQVRRALDEAARSVSALRARQDAQAVRRRPVETVTLAKRPTQAVAKREVPERNKAAVTLEKALDCKKRPESRKGGGSGRAFVPWCR